jgi:hypothetical protein
MVEADTVEEVMEVVVGNIFAHLEHLVPISLNLFGLMMLNMVRPVDMQHTYRLFVLMMNMNC